MKLLEQIEALPDPDRSELMAELARRVALAPHDLRQTKIWWRPRIIVYRTRSSRAA
jgi:hypothetical protein